MAIAKELYSLGISLLNVGKTRAAGLQFRKAMKVVPGFSDAALAWGHCLHLQRKYDEALAVYGQLVTDTPLLFAAWNNQGTTLLEMGRFEEAVASYLQALELAPDTHDARVALATCYQALGMVEEALTACETVLAADPGNAEAHWNRSLLLLLQGDYQEGWREYEWRWKKRNFSSPQRNFPQPRWHGEAAPGKTILVHAEQGFGDTLQFCRYVPLLTALGARVIFECHPPLVNLMSSLGGDVKVIGMGQPLPHFDLHVPLLSLPLIFNTTLETIPDTTPYLKTSAADLTWRHLVPEDKLLKVGLCWAGKTYPDPRRSCPSKLLAPLAGIEGVAWYSLQLGWQEELPFPMIDLTSHFRDFSDTATLIAQLDLVVTVDTAIAHLAGALCKPVCLMLPYASDWRWLTAREDSPWYPTMKLFRQGKPDSWQEIVQRVRKYLVLRATLI